MIKTQISAKPILHFSFLSIKNSSSASNPAAKFFLFHVSNFTTTLHHGGGGGGGSNSPATSYPSRRQEEESRHVRVSVWWDFENCNLPVGVNVFKVAQTITTAIRANGIKGPVQITAFGDVMQMSRQNQEALSSTGIYLNHVPRGGKNSADRSLLVDLMYWVSQNPPPAHLFLISGDRDFAGILHRLRMNNYNILLACTDTAPSVLCSAASIMWPWCSLLKGENLSGKHYNRPPDGPHGSWYGHYKAPLEDPFAVLEQPACPQASCQLVSLKTKAAEPSTCTLSEAKPDSVSGNKDKPKDVSDSVSGSEAQIIPKVVVKQIRQILCQHPNGISITDLRAELSRSNLTIDRDFYGHKKFSKFLLAMPHILNLQSRKDGQFLVRGVSPQIPEQVELKGEEDSVTAAKLNRGRGCSDAMSLPPSAGRLLTNAGKLEDPSTTMQKPMETPPELKVEIPSSDLQRPRTEAEVPAEVEEQPAVVQGVSDAKAPKSELQAIEQSPVSEDGLFKKFWRKWFGKKDSGAEGKILEEIKSENEDVKPLKESVLSAGMDSSLRDSDQEIQVHDDGTTRSQGSGSFRQCLKRMLWGSSECPNNSGVSHGKTNEVESASDKNKILGEKSFWDALQAFVNTREASAIVKLSRTRMQMVQDLQKRGPPVLKSLSEADLVHLAELMILDKKWIKESPDQNYPFKLVPSEEKDSSSQSRDVSHHSNGLRAVFSNTQPGSSSLRARAIVGEKRHAPETEVSDPAIVGVPIRKSRSEIMSDCQILLDDIVKKYPEGFDMGSFRKAFSERYGYSLDTQKLGYYKLATLLQIMPGVRVESSFILPAGNLAKCNSLDSGEPSGQDIDQDHTKPQSDKYTFDAFQKENDNFDSPWEELGPVANSISNKNRRMGPALNNIMKNETGQKLDHGYESVSDDYVTDSEEESLRSQKPESQNKSSVNEGDSSLLQILDSWYNTKEDNTKKDAPSDSRNGSSVSSSARSSTNSEISVINNGRKQRPSKTYSFVEDQAPENKDMLIDGILSSLKRSSEGSAETKM